MITLVGTMTMRIASKMQKASRRVLEMVGLRRSSTSEKMAARVRGMAKDLSERGVRVNAPHSRAGGGRAK